ncbi:response regulator [Undibacterium sp. Di24W]|uniref:response regulator n=1 Tax=Undibacterium sp. Di24W TaxID=3413033 RepID=UPI003BF14ECF
MHPEERNRVLLTEDNEFIQELVVDLLSEAGFSISTANNGQEALDLLAQHEADFFQLILMDLKMPVLDGHQATLKIRQQNKYDSIPIIALTAHEEVGTKESCLTVGMQDCLIKPFTPEVLNESILYWIGKTRHQKLANVSPASNDALPQFDHVDVRAGLRSTANNQALFLKLLRSFSTSQKNTLIQIENVQSVGSVDENFSRLIHTLKGVSATIGASKIAELSAQIEMAQKTALDQSRLGTITIQLLHQLENELTASLEELEIFFNQSTPLDVVDSQANEDKNSVRGVDIRQSLANLIQDDNPEAVNYFEIHSQAFATIFNNHDYIQLQKAIESYDFEQASKLLNTN